MNEPSWNEFEAKPGPAPAESVSEIDVACAEVFSASAGKRLLKALRERYFEGPFNPLTDERALRVRATQQQFVRDLETACQRGLAANAKRKAT